MELRNPTLGNPSFTRLYVQISEESGAFTVSVKLQNHRKKSEAAWGEEMASSIREEASSMIDALAASFSIPQKGISITITMANFKDGTLH